MWIALVLALAQEPATRESDHYLAWLDTPGGKLHFGLELVRPSKAPARAFLLNGEERIEVPRVELRAGELLLDMPHYDSRIRASTSPDSSGEWRGTWEKRRSLEVASLPFHAQQVLPELLGSSPPVAVPQDLSGRWQVNFSASEEPAVALFAQRGSALSGTFLTSTGDYRYLAGSAEVAHAITDGACAASTRLDFSLACFDGAHAFLFRGELVGDEVRGDFWSGNWHHETWTAKRDDAAELTDPFAQVRWNGTKRLEDLAFPDLFAETRALKTFAGPATLLVVFGSWCPNCNDEAALLKELDARYSERGLRILLLAFELTGDFRRDAEQVRIFQERHGLAHLPAFLCGTADKAEATRALGLVDRVRAFPTTIFVGADGLPRAIHSGFAGPATGEEHEKLRRDFAARIEALLGPR